METRSMNRSFLSPAVLILARPLPERPLTAEELEED